MGIREGLTSLDVIVRVKSSDIRVTIDLLLEGPNRVLAVEGKVFFFIRSESVAPLYNDSNKAVDNSRPRRTIRKPAHYRDFV
ncbi:hypothetical protein JHK82_039697 [Glycine max]|nr:hypothetical protein JHK86_039891 [Glycine max]KAG4965496.1 hypothetical protein JHK85_040471 [Glycine max]KAG5110474.1 hypothetical protein JHK82_039697 [Glycine max]